MVSSKVLRTVGIAAVIGLSFFTVACGTESGADLEATAREAIEQAPEEVLDVLAEALEGPDGKSERVFDTTDDNVLVVVEQTLSSQNAKASWDGNKLRVAVDGSATDVTASTPCLMLEAFLKDGEEAIISYKDGDIACSDR